MRRRLPLFLAGLLALTSVAGVGFLVRREPTRPAAATVATEPVSTRALHVLHGWDERRAQAWSEGSTSRLTTLYAIGSPAGAADRAMLRAYRDRGLRVIEMRRQTLAVRVLGSRPGELTVRVTDRLQRAVAVGPGVRERLPQSRVSTRTLTFRRTDRGWVLAG